MRFLDPYPLFYITSAYKILNILVLRTFSVPPKTLYSNRARSLTH